MACGKDADLRTGPCCTHATTTWCGLSARSRIGKSTCGSAKSANDTQYIYIGQYSIDEPPQTTAITRVSASKVMITFQAHR